jgi:hypothetical protein
VVKILNGITSIEEVQSVVIKHQIVILFTQKIFPSNKQMIFLNIIVMLKQSKNVLKEQNIC